VHIVAIASSRNLKEKENLNLNCTIDHYCVNVLIIFYQISDSGISQGVNAL
jgi:hypothetical protein